MKPMTQRKKFVMNRQRRRDAERRIAKGRFPFPEFLRWARSYFARYPETFIACDPGDLRSNITGEVKTYTVEELYQTLLDVKTADDEHIKQVMEKKVEEALANGEPTEEGEERSIDGGPGEAEQDSGLRAKESVDSTIDNQTPEGGV